MPHPIQLTQLLAQSRAEDHTAFADRLDDLLYHTAFTTSSELIGELRLAIRAFERTRPAMSLTLRQLLRDCNRYLRRPT